MKYVGAALLVLLASVVGAPAQAQPILCEASSEAALAVDGSSTVAVPPPVDGQAVHLCGWTILPNMQAQGMDVDVFFGAPAGKCSPSEAPTPDGNGVLVTTVPIDDLPRRRTGVNSSGQPWPAPRMPSIRLYNEIETEYRGLPKVAGAPVCVRSRGTNADGKVRLYYHVQ